MTHRMLIEEEKRVINYAIHSHPMTQLKTPDLLDSEKNSLFEISCQILYAAMPLILCFQLIILPTVINIYLIGNHESPLLMASVGLGSVLANIFGYMIIQNMAVGFSIVCSYFEEKREIGYMYQKTLGINFFHCILITPILYLSDKILLIMGFDHEIVVDATAYAWALVPSFYLFSFYDTTRNYLQSQKIIYPPLIVGTLGVIFHYCIAKYFIDMGFGITGAAWAKNLSDAFNSLVLYMFIIKTQPTKQSWIQWDICATNNIHKFLVQILSHQFFLYFQSLAFQILCIVACYMSTYSMVSAFFAFASTYFVYYFISMGVSHCLNRTFSLSIEDNDVSIGQRKVMLGVLFVLVFTVVVGLNLHANQEIYSQIYITDPDTVACISDNFTLFILVCIIGGVQTILQGVIKTLQNQQFWKVIVFCLYGIAMPLSAILCFYFHMGITGLWGGWLIGIFVLLCYEIKFLWAVNWEEDFQKVRDKYAVIQQNIRESRIEMTTKPF